ncbi:uncharacterized protein TRAVEDRAFT_22354 [Trametes versicolor FP-101664 SS1]|uniref:uncharacterized protein n=1 Tax=Trametes versicolor (strain FP-101664) TaxID=717944 RepID=UPI00046216B9|nr:uncharacterized protein TRAVEDRAFT_22354 [Trametes versicolor FP-101664 SS1]EIW55958.1 hypothetical protein TRAVEDRAFT_22354 [Trametes versicolor FP-101664 SS1]
MWLLVPEVAEGCSIGIGPEEETTRMSSISALLDKFDNMSPPPRSSYTPPPYLDDEYRDAEAILQDRFDWSTLVLNPPSVEEGRKHVVKRDSCTIHPPPCVEKEAMQPSPTAYTTPIPGPSSVARPTDSADAASSPTRETDTEDDDGFDFNFDFNLDFMWRSDSEESDDGLTDAEDDEPEGRSSGLANRASGGRRHRHNHLNALAVVAPFNPGGAQPKLQFHKPVALAPVASHFNASVPILGPPSNLRSSARLREKRKREKIEDEYEKENVPVGEHAYDVDENADSSEPGPSRPAKRRRVVFNQAEEEVENEGEEEEDVDAQSYQEDAAHGEEPTQASATTAQKCLLDGCQYELSGNYYEDWDHMLDADHFNQNADGRYPCTYRHCPGFKKVSGCKQKQAVQRHVMSEHWFDKVWCTWPDCTKFYYRDDLLKKHMKKHTT